MPRPAHDQLLLPDGSIRIMINTLEAEGIDPTPAIRASGYDFEPGSLQRRISPEQEAAFQRSFIELTGYRPNLWFRMGQDYSLATFGQFSLVMMTAPNLRALLTSMELGRFCFFGLELQPISVGNRLIGVAFDATPVAPDLRELALLVSLGCVLRLYPELVGDRFSFSLLCMPFDDPEGALRRIAGVPFIADAEQAVALWPDSVSELPLRNSNPVLFQAYNAAVSSLLQPQNRDEVFRARVQSVIRRNMGKIETLDEVAKALGMTARTMQRRLSRSGCTFRGLVEDCRREAAIREVAFHDIPLIDVAWGLGYSDFSSFAHAFQRWTGTSPGQFRRHAQGEANGNQRPALEERRTRQTHHRRPAPNFRPDARGARPVSTGDGPHLC